MTEPGERIFTLADIRRLLWNKRTQLLLCGLCVWAAMFGYLMLQRPLYRITATFKEGSDDASLLPFAEFLQLERSTPEAALLMLSQPVLKPLVERLGLQASVSQKSWLLTRLRRRLQDNIDAEKGRVLLDCNDFLFADVRYEGEQALSLWLCIDDAQVALYDAHQRPIASGALGERLLFPEGQLTVCALPQQHRQHAFYPLTISPWNAAVQALYKQLTITAHKKNTSFYDLTLRYPDRHRGATIVNELMEEYRRYLQHNHDALAQQQIAYLNARQIEEERKIAESLDAQAQTMARTLQEKGWTGPSMHEALAPLHALSDKLFTIDVELMRLDAWSRDDHWLAAVGDSPFAQKLTHIAQKVAHLRQKSDLLELAFHTTTPVDGHALQEVRQEQTEAAQLFEALTHEAPFNPTSMLAALGKEDCLHVLAHHIRLLAMREKMLQERLCYGTTPPSELEGIDLATAQTLLVKYNQQLDETEAELLSLRQLQEAIVQPDFQISSLSAALSDPLSVHLVEEASKLSIQCKDAAHTSTKEAVRWQEDLQLQKRILKDHLAQRAHVEELRSSLLKDKMIGLQRISLDAIHQQISALYEHGRCAIAEQRQALLNERALLEDKSAQLRQSLCSVPETWRLDKWLELRTQFGIQTMEAIVQLVEKQTTSHHLHHIASHAVDRPIPPTHAMAPRLFFKSMLATLGAVLLYAIALLLRQIAIGFPTSPEKLRAMGWPLIGTLGPTDTLRSLALSFAPQEIIALLSARGPDYAEQLAELLARQEKRVLLLSCDFCAPYAQEPGLLQFSAPQRKEGYDYLPSGGNSPHGADLLLSRSFAERLAAWKAAYDYILLLFRTPLDATESQVAQRLADRLVITVQSEPTALLTPFVDWSYHNHKGIALLCT